MTLPTSYWYLQHFDVKSLQESVDWFNFMSYVSSVVFNLKHLIALTVCSRIFMEYGTNSRSLSVHTSLPILISRRLIWGWTCSGGLVCRPTRLSLEWHGWVIVLSQGRAGTKIIAKVTFSTVDRSHCQTHRVTFQMASANSLEVPILDHALAPLGFSMTERFKILLRKIACHRNGITQRELSGSPGTATSGFHTMIQIHSSRRK